jgi:hypothetical protein
MQGYIERPIDDVGGNTDDNTDGEGKSPIDNVVDSVFADDYQKVKDDRISYDALMKLVRERSKKTGERPFILEVLDINKDAVVTKQVKVKRGEQSVQQTVFVGFETNRETIELWMSKDKWCGFKFAWDATCGFVYQKRHDDDWLRFDLSSTATMLRPYQFGFDRSMKLGELRDISAALAKNNKIDLLKDTILKLVPKAGEYERGGVDRFMREILHVVTPEGCADWYGDYLTKLSRYMWASYYARLTEPDGISLRTMPVLSSAEHAGKDAFAYIMAFRDCMDKFPSCFKDEQGAWRSNGLCGYVDFEMDDRTFANNSQGKSIVVFPELGKLDKGDMNRIKKMITDSVDSYNEKYLPGTQTQVRRWFPMMNTNEAQFLCKPLGKTRLFKIELEKSEKLGRGENQVVIELDKFKEVLPYLLAEGRDFALERVKESKGWTTQSDITRGVSLLNDDLMPYGERVTEQAQYNDPDKDIVAEILSPPKFQWTKGEPVSWEQIINQMKKKDVKIDTRKLSRILKELEWTQAKRTNRGSGGWYPPENWGK